LQQVRVEKEGLIVVGWETMSWNKSTLFFALRVVTIGVCSYLKVNNLGLDVNNASLHDNLNEEIYTKIPSRLHINDKNCVCRLQ